MKNIHLLPTDKPSRLGRFIDTNNLFLRTTDDIPRGENINIYITNDEEIKEGDWVYNTVSENIFKASKQLIDLINDPNVTLTTNKKIILTTDKDLIKDGVQAIDDDYLEWFVKNANESGVPFDRCEVDKEYIFFTKEGYGDWYYNDYKLSDLPINYKIIIPKEEPKDVILGYKTSLDAQMLDKIEPKQERMYSEEEMISFAEFVATYPDKNRNVYGEMLHSKSKYDEAERTIDLLEQFKKK
jgi:gamma-glutamylcyclotransferase (GGCT)/AIG2-like uncharacterized protein YtfP